VSELDIAERRVPQDGRFKIAINGRPIDFRVSIIPSIFGEDAVLRILDKQALTKMSGLRLDVLGFESNIIEQLRRLAALHLRHAAGHRSTGSGKTTTLYAAISETQTDSTNHHHRGPVEYQLPGVLQIPVNEKKGLTFARGLRSILRHDPDKIMVGEIRDPETAQIAIQSALTGHLVFNHRACQQRLRRRQPLRAHGGGFAWLRVGAVGGDGAAPGAHRVRAMLRVLHALTRAARGIACYRSRPAPRTSSAGTRLRALSRPGYQGRKAVGEGLMVLNDEIREAIVSRVPVRQRKELRGQAGVRLIRTAALDLVRRGHTTVEKVNRVTIMA